MQAEITVHVLRLKNNNEIVDVESINDMYSEVGVKYLASQGEAKDIPSIGNYLSCIETKTQEWE